MSVNTPVVNIKKEAQQRVVDLCRSVQMNFLSTWNVRAQLQEADRIFMCEQDRTIENMKATLANAAGDPTKFRNIQVPVAYSAIESAVTYQTSVFLTGVPLFGVSASADFMDAALQMESVLDNQAVRGGWVRELQMLFRDGFKYNIGALHVDWTVQKIYTPETDLAYSTKQGKPTTVLYAGNTVKKLDLYNTFWDVRYNPVDVPKKGEFVGWTEMMSRMEFIRMAKSLEVRMNYTAALSAGPTVTTNSFPAEYFIPMLNPHALVDAENVGNINWMSWAGLVSSKGTPEFHNTYYVTTLYARVIPADLGLPATNQHDPQIWKFVVVNQQVLLYAERQTNAHDLLPVLFCQPSEDGLGYQTKSMTRMAQPFQAVSSALVNSAIAARRRAVSDRGLYDPLRVEAKHINSDSPTAKIPVRPAAYGKPLGEAYFPIPFRDDQSQNAMGDLQVMMALNDQTIGLNKAQQGQFVKGNKTLFEFDSVMNAANARPQSVALLLEAQLFTPLKDLLKLNILQYQEADEIYNRETESVVPIDPIALRKAKLLFKVSDGVIPAAKQMNTEAFQSAVQTLATIPQIGAGYNLTPMFTYLFKQQRADVAQFEKSPQLVQYEQALSAWQSTCATLAEHMAKMKDEAGNLPTPESITKALPAQPTPAQYGLDPNNPYAAPTKPSGTVLQQTQVKLNEANQKQS